MKIASIVIKNTGNIDRNISLMIDGIKEAKLNNADMVLFSEGEITGKIYGKDSTFDKKLALSVTDEKLKIFSSMSIDLEVIIGFGFLELKNNKYYNTYIMYDKEGKIKVNYRMINENWHYSNSNYDSGESINCWVIDDLSFSILSGDDCLDEVNQSMVNALDVDICFIPRAKTFNDLKTKNLLDHQLLPYVEATKKMNTNVLLINQYLELDNELIYYGGITEINSNSSIENSLGIKKEGILYTNI